MKSNYDIARQRVKKKSDFRAHLMTYLIICAFLLVINLLTSPGYLWAVWPALGWGIGVAFHAFSVMGIITDEDKKEELIEKELRRMERKEQAETIEDEDQLELRELRKEPRYNDDEFV